MAHTSPSDSIHGSSESDSVPSRDPFLHPRLDQLQGWIDAPNDKCYSSFGDGGTTATVNAYGNIIQFSTPIKEIESGIAVADHARVPEPYWIESRTSEILKLSEEKVYEGPTFGFCLDDLLANSSPSLTYVNYRWPRFEYKKNQGGLSTTIQWAVFDGTVLQQCTFKNNGTKHTFVNFKFRTKMCIRDVDFLDPSHHFNADLDSATEDYTDRKSPDNSSWLRLHKLSKGSGCVAVVVSLFVDGKKYHWGDDFTWKLPLGRDQSMEIIFAYKMVHTTVAQPSSELSISDEVTKIGNILRDEAFSNVLRLVDSPSSRTPDDGMKGPSGVPTISAAEHLEYLLHRNLEHILSVCAIPTTGFQMPGGGSDPHKNLRIPIVLTCGDVSFHRVSTAASLFALQFIIESAKRIRSLREDEVPKDGKYNTYADRLLTRITTVCQGHLCWLLCTKKTASGLFAANYWVPGSIMEQQSEESWNSDKSWIPNDSATDTALQLIKIQACLDFLEISHTEFQPTIGDVTRQWLVDLEQKKPRGAYVWPHSQKADTKFYRLDDNIWIWKALKDIEVGDLLPSTTNSSSSIPELGRKGAYRDVQQAVLRRFTTENGMLRQRMLAVSRSSRDTRFLYHSRDTVLFYAKDWAFILPDTNFAEVWNNTIDVQKYHEENQETRWDNALRYALSIVMACDGHSINRKSPSDVIKGSLRVLINSSSPNGLLMGQLDETSKKPIQFVNERDRDFYFHASFEIPFILLTKATEILRRFDRNLTPAAPEYTSGANASNDTVASQSTPQQIINISLANRVGEPMHLETGTGIAFVTNNAQNARTSSSALVKPMKKTIPFNDLVEARSVIEMEDEWLFNHPSFFSERHERSSDLCADIVKVLEDIKASGIPLGATMEQATTAWRRKLSKSTTSMTIEPESLVDLVDNYTRRVMMVDIAKKKKSKGKKVATDEIADTATALSNAELWKRLVQPRTAESAKKRFVWLREPDHDTAMLSLAGSPKNESIPMSLFFDMHSQADQHFSEDTTMYLNTWDTELHLSFYQLRPWPKSSSSILSGALTSSLGDFLPGLRGFQVVKASTGFRFVGDFFDRFWTCHFIEYLPGAKEVSDRSSVQFYAENIETSDWDFKFKPSSEDRSWTQRKILELHLFERMLTRLVESTRGIFDTLQGRFKTPWSEFALIELDERNYFQSSRHWQETQNSLKVIADRLEHTNDIIMRWESREEDRVGEQPRWTRYDEGKYRRTINKLHISTNSVIREFRTLHAKINSFGESLITRQDQIRNEVALRGSENIRFFTYATVVFLPLGFASSIFSMSAVPDHELVKNMVIFALVALIITILAVLSAEAVFGGIKKVFDAVWWGPVLIEKRLEIQYMFHRVKERYARERNSRAREDIPI